MICHIIHIAMHSRTIKNPKQPKRPAELSHENGMLGGIPDDREALATARVRTLPTW
jgi:hypothetical protein